MSPVFFEFGDFRLDVTKRTLFRDGQPAPLPPKVFDTLLELVRHAGEVVTKEEFRGRLARYGGRGKQPAPATSLCFAKLSEKARSNISTS